MTTTDPRLIEYALGTAAPDERRTLERELKSDTALRAELEDLMRLFHALDDAQPRPPMRPATRDRLLQAVTSGESFEGFVDRFAELFDLGANRARVLLARVDKQSSPHWEPSGIPGVRLLHFPGGPRAADADCGIVHLEAGTVFPAHRHGAEEWALMLRGEILEDSGARFLPGDMVLKEAGSTHSFRAGNQGPAAFAVLTDIHSMEFLAAPS